MLAAECQLGCWHVWTYLLWRHLTYGLPLSLGFCGVTRISYRNNVTLQACNCKVLAALIEMNMPVACRFLISKYVFLIRSFFYLFFFFFWQLVGKMYCCFWFFFTTFCSVVPEEVRVSKIRLLLHSWFYALKPINVLTGSSFIFCCFQPPENFLMDV